MRNMGRRILFVAAGGLVSLSACSHDLSGPGTGFDNVDLLPDYSVSAASVIDGAGIGGAQFPDSLKLTADQKAAIATLHDAFTQAHATDLAALRDIEKQLHDLKKSGGTLDQARALLEQAHAIQHKLADAFAVLQDAIWQLYTPAQRDWINAHKPRVCGASGAPALSDAQIQQIRALRDAFQTAVSADLTLLKQIHQQAEAARQAGKTQSEIDAIIATAKDALARVHAAEVKLGQDIQAVLTPEQRANWCVIRNQVIPKHP